MSKLNPKPRGLSVARLMGLVALIALAFAWPPSWLLVVPVLADWLGGLALGPAWGRPLALVLGAVYGPTVIGFFGDCNHCRETWEWLWPGVPGLLAAGLIRHWLGFARGSDGASIAAGFALTLGVVVIATLLARLGRGWRIGTLVVTALLSGLASQATYSLLRS